MKRKRKKNYKKIRQGRLYSILILFFCVGCGSLLLYRAQLQKSELIKIDGKLNEIILSEGYGKRGRQCILLLDIEGFENKTHGIHVGTKEQAIKKAKKLNLTTGLEYSYFLDPSVSSFTNNTLFSIRLIKKGNTIVYKTNPIPEIVFGSFLVLMGVFSFVFFNVMAKRKFG